EHVGVQLFDRTRKPVALCPTTAGQRVQIERLAGMLRELVQDLRKGAQAAANRIVIASQHALTAALTPAVIEKIRRQNENIYVRLTSANLDECFAQLLARQADIVIAYRLPGSEHPVRPDFIEAAEIGHDWLVPVIATSHLDRLELQLEAGHVPY